MSWPAQQAALAARRLAVVVELQRDADDVVPGALQSAATTEESTPPDMATTTRVRAPRAARACLDLRRWHDSAVS